MQRKRQIPVGRKNNFIQNTSENTMKTNVHCHLQSCSDSHRVSDVTGINHKSSPINSFLSPSGDGSNFRLLGIYFPIYNFHSICSRAKKYINKLLLYNRILDLASNNKNWGVNKVIYTNSKEVYIFSNTRSSIVSCASLTHSHSFDSTD
jgi:hypothetical protein